MRNELDIKTLQKAKGNAVAFYNACEEPEDREFWTQVIEDCDEEIKAISKEPLRQIDRVKVAMLIIILALIAFLVFGCNAVQGVGKDITWMGAAGQEMLEHGHKYMEK